jgi:BlaI family transcriptional regulator, penicillinase repressor
MKKPPRISDAEWRIMQVLWADNPLNATEIKTRSGFHLQTAKTYLTRLVKKGAIGFKKAGRSYLYHPLFTEADCQKSASKSFLDRVFGGSLHPMLSHLVEDDALSNQEIAQLRKILNRTKR